MNKKKVFAAVGCLILVAAVLAGGIWFVKYRSAERAATRKEMDAHALYIVDWHRVSCWQEGMTEKELILSLCTPDPENEGFYTSETLGQLLYNCEAVDEISVYDGVLHVAYRKTGGGRAGFDYDDQGLSRLWVWDQKKDTLYQQRADGATVTTNYYQSLRRRVQ